MNDNNENKSLGHLRVLSCSTVILIALVLESLLLDWDKSAFVLIFFGVAASWTLHLTEKLTPDVRLWLYAIMSMVAFFYYGIHETSIYDLAPVMIVVILMMAGTEKYALVRLCTFTYCFTMAYSLLFVAESIEYDSLVISRTALHFGLVIAADILVRSIIRERERLRKITEGRMEELKEVNHRAENFLVNVSHELRTPINVIMGIASVMLNRESDAEKRRNILSIEKAGHRLFDQIEDILDYSELEAGRMIVNSDDYMISSVVNDIVIAEQSNEDDRRPEIVFDVDPKIPARLVGDDRKIKKILKHLINNAVKFAPDGAVLVEISGVPKNYGVNLDIRVTDNGIGMKEETVRNLFVQLYQQNGERNRSTGGLGLGLTIVHGMVAAMGGFIRIDSKENEGTTVCVSIPQGVSDDIPSMSVENPKELCAACYLKPEKYKLPEIRLYYNSVISHIARDVDVELHKAENEQQLEHIVSRYRITHLFIGKEEYADRPSYYDELAKEMIVTVVTDNVRALPRESGVIALKKPFYFLPVIDILNANTKSGTTLFDTRKIYCPGIRALVVDDEPMNLLVAKEILKGYQMRVETADSGKAAINLCLNEEFDIVFLDHMMPEMDGVETLKHIRSNENDSNTSTTVIAFTANAVSGAREMFLREGFNEFLSKPIEIKELNRVLKKVLPKTAITYSPDEKPQEAADLSAENGTAADTADVIGALEHGGIHTENGLPYCRNDMELYEKILTSFVNDAEKKRSDMRGYLSSGDYGNYRVVVHSLKSSAKMIGADELSEAARAAEDAAKALNGAYLKEHETELAEKYSAVVRCIADALHIKTEPSEEAGAGLVELDRGDFRDVLDELWECLGDFDESTAERLIAGINSASYCGCPLRGILSEIIEDIESRDISAAKEKTEALIKAAEGGDAQ